MKTFLPMNGCCWSLGPIHPSNAAFNHRCCPFSSIAVNNLIEATVRKSEVHQNGRPVSPSWDEGAIKAKMRGRKEDSIQHGRQEISGKHPTKAEESWERLGHVLRDSHKPNEGEALFSPDFIRRKHNRPWK